MKSETITLSEPLKTHDGDVTTIKVNEPRARSFFDHGEPFKMRVVTDGEKEHVEFDYSQAVLKKFFMDMTGIDDIILGKLSAGDYFKLRNAMTNLILGVAGKNPTTT